MKLKNSAIAEIKKNKALIRALEDLHEKAPFTIQQWLYKNNPMLCHISSLTVISAYLKKDVEELIEKTEADFINVNI